MSLKISESAHVKLEKLFQIQKISDFMRMLKTFLKLRLLTGHFIKFSGTIKYLNEV